MPFEQLAEVPPTPDTPVAPDPAAPPVAAPEAPPEAPEVESAPSVAEETPVSPDVKPPQPPTEPEPGTIEFDGKKYTPEQLASEQARWRADQSELAARRRNEELGLSRDITREEAIAIARQELQSELGGETAEEVLDAKRIGEILDEKFAQWNEEQQARAEVNSAVDSLFAKVKSEISAEGSKVGFADPGEVEQIIVDLMNKNPSVSIHDERAMGAITAQALAESHANGFAYHQQWLKSPAGQAAVKAEYGDKFVDEFLKSKPAATESVPSRGAPGAAPVNEQTPEKMAAMFNKDPEAFHEFVASKVPD